MELTLVIYIILIVILICISGFFSGSETGLTAVSRAKIYKLRTSGDKRAILVTRLRANKDRLIGTILLGNNAVNILASALATSVAIKLYGEGGVIYATIIMTFIVLIFAEVLPKTFALYHAETVSLFVARPLTILSKLLFPITNIVQKMVATFLTILGINKAYDDPKSVEELKGAIDLHHHEGRVVKGEKDMLQSVLDLSKTEVDEVMIHRKNIFSLNADEPPSEIIAKILDSDHTRIPLWRDDPDNVVGVLHVKALLRGLRLYDGDIDEINIMDMASNPWFVPETNTLDNQLYQFRKKRTHMALVVDEYGALVGLVTLEDILEEIVGQIEDEHDQVGRQIRALKSGKYRIEGETTIRDINRQLEWNLPDAEATTIAGLIMHNAESIPDEGQEFKFDGCWFKVEKKEENQIVSVLAKKG